MEELHQSEPGGEIGNPVGHPAVAACHRPRPVPGLFEHQAVPLIDEVRGLVGPRRIRGGGIVQDVVLRVEGEQDEVRLDWEAWSLKIRSSWAVP